ncbi:MAG: hypothetical protein LBF60_00625 [Treponema sp.]|jgi:hypothetical protein|nr:hypothetical protein [Treponema sp.]
MPSGFCLRKRTCKPQETANGKTAVFKPEKKARPKNRLGKPVCTGETAGALEKIRAFYGGKRGPAFGPHLSVIIRQNIAALLSSRKPDFHITPEIRARPLRISGRQTGRALKPAKGALRLRGISGAKTAREIPLKQMPVGTRCSEDEAKTPGFCQTDTDGWQSAVTAETAIRGGLTSL